MNSLKIIPGKILADWKKRLEPFYDKASFMLGRVKYSKLNIEDRILQDVSADMNARESFDTVHVGVNLDQERRAGE